MSMDGTLISSQVYVLKLNKLLLHQHYSSAKLVTNS